MFRDRTHVFSLLLGNLCPRASSIVFKERQKGSTEESLRMLREESGGLKLIPISMVDELVVAAWPSLFL